MGIAMSPPPAAAAFFFVRVTGLAAHTGHVFRAYAVNEAGTAFGGKAAFITTPRGDLDTDCQVTLADVIVALRVASGIPVSSLSTAGDGNGDGRVGIEDAVFSLWEIAKP